MSTLVCVPITVEEIDASLADAALARDLGADFVELRIDGFFPGSEGDAEDAYRLEQLRSLLAECPLPVILTCRSAVEGGDYDGDEADRVSLLQKLCVETDHPPAYLDFELARYRASANIRQKIDLCVDHPTQQRDQRTRLILSMHDFEGRPSDLMRRLADAWAEPSASVVKFAFRARSIRDNLEIFEILRDAPKPTIGLGMGEFGLMSRVLASKFGGFLTFASLRDSSATAPGQPTLIDLLGMYRFRSIGKDTRVYGVIGWPVSQSMSPLVHNAGFEARGWDGVYLPMPVPDSDEAFKATVLSLMDDCKLGFDGASVTIPHKLRLDRFAKEHGVGHLGPWRSWNTLMHTTGDEFPWMVDNTDQYGVIYPVQESGVDVADTDVVAIIGAGGVAETAAKVASIYLSDHTDIFARRLDHAEDLAVYLRNAKKVRIQMDLDSEKVVGHSPSGDPIRRLDAAGEPQECEITVRSRPIDELAESNAKLYINCTPVGMTGGPDPDGLSIPVHELAGRLPPETVFFDTVYNPIETPMLRAAKEHGFRTIDGVEMFVRQAAAQFELWTGERAPTELFDRLVREKLTTGD